MRQHATISNHRQQKIGHRLGGKLPLANFQAASSDINVGAGEFVNTIQIQRRTAERRQPQIERIALENSAKRSRDDGPNAQMLQRLCRLFRR